ncbi:MAG: HEAT repeat domain-containing protein [Phycisphaerales bacterium]|nr:MAG: HEAT repeat domain-containing protein [Phycisphaerales bacterium]
MPLPSFPLFGVRPGRLAWTAVLVLWLAAAWPGIAQEDTEDEPGAPPDATKPDGPYDDFHDFVHFARIGRFDAAEAVATRLLSHPDLDPVQLLEAAETDPRSIDTLLLVINKTEISATAGKVLEVIRQGEFELRRDPARIKENVEKLSGPPQTEYNAIQRLRESGEYAIPWMVDALSDPDKKTLWPRIVRALPQIGGEAVSPLVQALETDSGDLQLIITKALGELGYAQAVPYLQKLHAREGVSELTKRAVREAIQRIAARSGREFPTEAATSFTALAERYYNEDGSVRADPRVPQANLWELRDGFLVAIAVPTEIHGPVMAMRCTRDALLLAPDRADAIALWLAADIRREARLGMDVESGELDPAAGNDPSTPEDFPRSIYFSRAAGPAHCHRVLERAVRDRDSAVALGAIAALRATAGATSLVGTEDYKQPLVQALQFPDRVVRIKAALALAEALPKTPFAGAQSVPSVLSEALNQQSNPQYVVVDPDQENLNRVIGALRGTGAVVLGSTDFYDTIARARKEVDQVACFFLATDTGAPDLAGALRQLRGEFIYAATPIVLLVKPAHLSAAEEWADRLTGLDQADAGASATELAAAADRASAEAAQIALEPAMALELALETADVLRRVALDGRTPINIEAAEPALISALAADSEELRVKVASVLALSHSARAQQAVARVALSSDQAEPLRIAMFESLAESAKRNGNRLEPQLVNELIQIAAEEPVLTLRTSASKALGALNLSDNRASEIIRKYHQR